MAEHLETVTPSEMHLNGAPGLYAPAALESSPPPTASTSALPTPAPDSPPKVGPTHKRKLSLTPGESDSPAPDPVPLSADSSAFELGYSVVPGPVLSFPPSNVTLPQSPFEFFAPRNHPVNRQGWRYTPCAPSDAPEFRGKLAVPFQRLIESEPQGVRWSWEDRSPFVYLTEDAQTITAQKGWRAARSNVGVREGGWYWEIRVHRAGGEGGRDTEGGEGEGSWCRVGLGRRESSLNAPVGIDGHSYAYRDKGGESVTLARPTAYGAPFKSGSVIGVYVSLPPRMPPSTTDRRDPARIVRKRIPILYKKGRLFFESVEYSPSPEMMDLAVDPITKAKLEAEALAAKEKAKRAAAAPGSKPSAPPPEEPAPRELPLLEGSKVAFFLDGVCQGVAFEDIYDFLPLRPNPGERKKAGPTGRQNWHDDGELGYYPFVSVFGGAIASINPGPDFDFPPPSDIDQALAQSARPGKAAARGGEQWRPLSDRYAEYLAEQDALDTMDEAEAVRRFERSLAEQAARPPPTGHSATQKRSKLSTSIIPKQEEDDGATIDSRSSSVSLSLPPQHSLALPPAVIDRTQTDSRLASPILSTVGEMMPAEEVVVDSAVNSPLPSLAGADERAGEEEAMRFS